MLFYMLWFIQESLLQCGEEEKAKTTAGTGYQNRDHGTIARDGSVMERGVFYMETWHLRFYITRLSAAGRV